LNPAYANATDNEIGAIERVLDAFPGTNLQRRTGAFQDRVTDSANQLLAFAVDVPLDKLVDCELLP
jgi:hypothetical protein